MKKKLYYKPTMSIVEIQQQSLLNSGSGIDSKRNGYGKATVEDWD